MRKVSHITNTYIRVYYLQVITTQMSLLKSGLKQMHASGIYKKNDD